MTRIDVLDHDAVLAAVSPEAAIDAVREAFMRHYRGEWVMPPKVYLDSPGFGDFRAMPARGDGLALLKWITSFPGNPSRGLPTVTGIVCVSDSNTGEPLMLLDARSVTALRTGAVAADVLLPVRGSPLGPGRVVLPGPDDRFVRHGARGHGPDGAGAAQRRRSTLVDVPGTGAGA